MAGLVIQSRQDSVEMGNHLLHDLAGKAFVEVTKHPASSAEDTGKVIQKDALQLKMRQIVLDCISLANAHASKLVMQLSLDLSSGWLKDQRLASKSARMDLELD